MAELRAQDSPTRVLLLAREEGTVVGSGMADRSETAGGAFAAPRVVPEHRRQGVGTALLHALADHCVGLGLPELRSSVDDEESLAFALHFGFVETDRQVEQRRAVGEEADPGGPPDDVEVVLLSERPELWAASHEGFGQGGARRLRAVPAPGGQRRPVERLLGRGPDVPGLSDGEVVGCAGLHLDTDQPERAENSLTAVRRAGGAVGSRRT